ncbi:MAG: hypothetical protein V7765_16590 [Oleispira sp.]
MIQLHVTKQWLAWQSLNRIKGDVEHMIWYDDAQVADKPCNIKGQKNFIMPNKAMLELLDKVFLLKGNGN